MSLHTSMPLSDRRMLTAISRLSFDIWQDHEQVHITPFGRRATRPRAKEDYLQRLKPIVDAVNHRRNDFRGRRNWTPNIRLLRQGPHRRVSKVIIRLLGMDARPSGSSDLARMAENALRNVIFGQMQYAPGTGFGGRAR